MYVVNWRCRWLTFWKRELEKCEKEGNVEGMAEAKEQITVWESMTDEEYDKQKAAGWDLKIEEWKKNGHYDRLEKAVDEIIKELEAANE